jgi:hypothetical protein
MKKSTLYYIWLGFFGLCFGLSLIPTPSEALSVVLKILSVGFFVPPAVLLVQAKLAGDQKTVKILRIISGLSLGLTLAFIIFNIMAMASPEWVGNLLHYALIFVSVPMQGLGSWALSLFLWACLLFSGFIKADRK